jgi:glucose/arabinose dehydrogenase
VPNSQTTGGEGGLMGVAVDPDWATNHYVYFMHTAAEGNRIARMTYNGTSLTGYTVLLQGISKALPQRRTARLRPRRLSVRHDRRRPEHLPRPGPELPQRQDPAPDHLRAAGPRQPLRQLRLQPRPPQPAGLAFDRNGRLWEAEFGNTRFDELNLIKPGANYGWPTCEGTCSTAGMTNPKKTWTTGEASPSAIAIADNVVYMAALRGERLWRIPIDGDTENVGTATAYYVGTYGRLRTVVKVPGSEQLWLATTNADTNGGQPDGADRVLRVTLG